MTDSARKLTWITPKWPLPSDDGAKNATTQLVKHLVAEGARIHLCSIVSPIEDIDVEQARRELGVAEVSVVRREKDTAALRFRTFLQRPGLPLTIAPYATHGVRTCVGHVIASNPNSLVVYDGLHCAGSYVGSKPQVTSIYRAHNIERDIWIRGAHQSTNPAMKALMRWQAGRIGKFEEAICRAASVVFSVSQVDATQLKRLAPKTLVVSLPIGMPATYADHEVPEPALNTTNILFVGRLDWRPNRDGLRWFLENVWNEVAKRRPDMSLTIVGSGDGSWLKAFESAPRVRVVGRVESLSSYFEECLATIVPVFFGSGTRVKVIEASLHGRMCLSTELGVEGVEFTCGEHYVRAETVKEWIDALASLERTQALAIGQRALRHATVLFEPKKLAKRFIETLRQAGLA